jgi:hypothetical protein
MTIKIATVPTGDALAVSGNISSVLPLPPEHCRALAIGLSDGTLLEARLSEEPLGRFRVTKEGAAITVINDDHVRVEWPIEWLTVSGIDQALASKRDPEPLPLFPEAA